MERKLNKKHKFVLDNVHGVIPLSNIACQIIDTHEFQRLRDIRQLGLCHYIWPTSVHTRFAHSLGVYHVTGIMLESLKENSNKEHVTECLKKVDLLKDNEPILSDLVCELIKIAGLVHDLGHNCYSHAFDELVSDMDSKMKRHETRSQYLFEKIVREHKINITDNEIKFIQKLIDPTEYDVGFVYQIVSNLSNGIDVDKFDYIIRDSASINQHFGFNWQVLCTNVAVIDNTICYKLQVNNCINSMFNARYQLHKEMYCHKSVLAIEFMILDIIRKIDKKYNIKNSILDDSFLKMTDSKIMNYIMDLDHTDEAWLLYDRIIKRKLYKHCGTIITRINPFKPVIPKKISVEEICKRSDNKVCPNDILMFETKLGYISGNKKNPLNNIYLYEKDNNMKKLRLSLQDVASLTDGAFQEYNVFYFCKVMEKSPIVKSIVSAYKDDIQKSKMISNM